MKDTSKKLLCLFMNIFFIIAVSTNVYAASYPKPFELPELTGNQRKDFVAVAKSQLGYTEGEDGSSYFGAWAGDPYQAWCSEFVAWCVKNANISYDVIPNGDSSYEYRDFFAAKNNYYYIEGGVDGKNTKFMREYSNISTVSIEEAEFGDIILTESDGDIDNGPDHTAIFLGYENGMLLTISGNCSNSVCMKKEYLNECHGLCKPDFQNFEVVDKDLGDVNNDGSVTVKDAVLALQMSTGKRVVDLKADVNGDGVVTTKDAVRILRYSTGKTKNI